MRLWAVNSKRCTIGMFRIHHLDCLCCWGGLRSTGSINEHDGISPIHLPFNLEMTGDIWLRFYRNSNSVDKHFIFVMNTEKLVFFSLTEQSASIFLRKFQYQTCKWSYNFFVFFIETYINIVTKCFVLYFMCIYWSYSFRCCCCSCLPITVHKWLF